MLEGRLLLDAGPLLDLPESLTIDEDVAGEVVIVLTDVGADPVEMTLAAEHGTLTLSDITGLTFLGGGNGQASMAFEGTPDALNAALATLTYLGDQDYKGSD